MSTVGYASLQIIPSMRDFGTALNRQMAPAVASAGQSASRSLVAAVGGGALRVAGIVGGAALTVGGLVAGVAAKGGLSRALSIQEAREQLTGLKHDTATVDQVMANALASVKGTAFGLGDAATVAASVVAAGVAPGQALERTLRLTADAATIAKAPLGEMGSMFNKVASSGKLTTEVVNQFSDRGVPLLQFVAKEFGVTAEAAAEMVTEGKVSFEDFQKALENNVGGAALRSGQTARGALANVYAALGRVGARFLGGAVNSAPGLFQSIAAAVDRADAALAPYADKFNALLVPALDRLRAYIDRIDFGKIVAGLQGLYDLVVRGDFSTGLREAFNIEEDSTFVVFVTTARNALIGLFALIVGGQFTSELRSAFNIEEDSGFVSFVLGARDAVSDFVSSLSQGDLGGAASSIGASLTTLQPAFAEFGRQLPAIASAAGELVAGGITVLAGVLGFLAANVDTIIAVMPAIVAGFVAWRLWAGLTASATLSLQAAQLLALPVTTANTFARLAAARAELQVAAATGTSTAATNGGALASARSTIATVASGIAQRALAIGQGIATAAQWAFNAALSANPIGLVIAAIVALVAGLVWFFTQTEVGKKAWQAFVDFLVGAWEFIRSAIASIALAIALSVARFVLGVREHVDGVFGFFRDLGSNILKGLSGFGNLLVDTGRNLIEGLKKGIQQVAGGIADFVLGPVKDAVNGVKNFLGIKSPSRLMRQIGIYTVEGMADGLNRAAPLVARASDALVPSLPAIDPIVAPDVEAGGMFGRLDRLEQGGPGWAGTAPQVTNHIELREEDPRVVARKFGREFNRAMAGAAA